VSAMSLSAYPIAPALSVCFASGEQSSIVIATISVGGSCWRSCWTASISAAGAKRTAARTTESKSVVQGSSPAAGP
jgi:hypothetical protein